MTSISRRSFLRATAGSAGAAAALSVLPMSIQKALAVSANNRTGTIQDVEHIVIFMQENRAFDHYFGALHGVRGFGDRFPIPVPDTATLVGKTVWYQRNDAATGSNPKILAPQHNDTTQNFALIRTADTPHLYPDAQNAWDGGRMSNWPQYKNNASMVYYTQADMPYQYALANAFTLCDAYHSSFTGGTNPNRCFHFSGSNHGHDDPNQAGVFNGPAMDNSYNALTNGPVKSGYTWMTFAETLQAAGITWQVYQNEEKEFFALNSLLGFKSFRDANAASVPNVSPNRTPLQQALYEKGIRTRDLDLLKADVLAGTLPQVSWICATSSGSEHPSSLSPPRARRTRRKCSTRSPPIPTYGEKRCFCSTSTRTTASSITWRHRRRRHTSRGTPIPSSPRSQAPPRWTYPTNILATPTAASPAWTRPSIIRTDWVHACPCMSSRPGPRAVG